MSRPAALRGPPIELFINNLGEDALDFIRHLRANRAVAERLAPPTTLEDLVDIDSYIERVTEAMAIKAIGGDKPLDFGMALRKVLGNGVKHPLLHELPYRPWVNSYLLPPYAWATVTAENPGFDPRKTPRQTTPNPTPLLEPNDRSDISTTEYADFSAWALLAGEPWTHYVAVAYEQPR
jgi:hypothetical protein